MSESYILHDVMRKVKADGLFDSIRRDLIADIEQKPSYIDLKAQIESSMSSYLSEHQWSSSLKKSDIRERARRHIETSTLIKDTLPSLVSQYMQTCQQQLVQPRLSSFVSDHIQFVYNSIGGAHIYHPSTSYTQSNSMKPDFSNQEKSAPAPKQEPPPPTTTTAKTADPIPPPTPTIDKKIPLPTSSLSKIPKKKKVTPNPTTTVTKEEKKPSILSPLHSPHELVDVSPSPPNIDNERTIISLSPSPPPPVVRIASPLASSKTKETPPKTKHLKNKHNDDRSKLHLKKKKKLKLNDVPKKPLVEDKSDDVIFISTISSEKDSRKLRPRRPNPKYANEFETGDIEIIESSSPPSKPKKNRCSKSSTIVEPEHLDTPSSPVPASAAPIEPAVSIGNISPEYEASLRSLVPEQQVEKVNKPSRTPSPVPVETTKSTSPRRLRPRRLQERSLVTETSNEKTNDVPVRTSMKTRESTRNRADQSSVASTQDDANPPPTKKTRLSSSSSSTTDTTSKELPSRSVSMPDTLTATSDEGPAAPTSPSSSGPVSKSFIWKPKISK